MSYGIYLGIITDYTIGIDTIPNMVAKVQEMPWPIYKVKLGSAEDVAIIKAIRQVSNSRIRIDANAGWTLEQAKEIIPQLAALQVELVEQPLAKDDWQGMEQLATLKLIPLIADESCVVEQDVAKCLTVFDGINIKLTKCSGLTPALRMVQEAKQANKLIMMGCMNESMVGTAAMAQFLPQLHYFDGDGPLLHSHELATGLAINNGVVQLGNFKGLGIRITEEVWHGLK
jgi:L-Ala-D/L-Glu epimerase